MVELRRPEISFPPFWFSRAVVEVIQSYFLENQLKGFGGSTSWYTENISRGGSYTSLRTANLCG
ncbi:hypothetical protein NC653_036762 [Populus alba x Populus x berolinensis]|uniref:Uncharacterized protein n=1 Tax=Populus alba x Populus x berolinensis TaxID=444605 RepID=A0AAD6LKX1_9ROSI|nr:hypothetical protein NC653_036762 [Populus alba x Populus x berolinensis]